MASSFVFHLSPSHTSYIRALTLIKTVMQILVPLATFAKPLIRKLRVTAVSAFTFLAKLRSIVLGSELGIVIHALISLQLDC